MNDYVWHAEVGDDVIQLYALANDDSEAIGAAIDYSQQMNVTVYVRKLGNPLAEVRGNTVLFHGNGIYSEISIPCLKHLAANYLRPIIA